MAKYPDNFIGLDALTHVADQVSKEIIMGPGYSDAEEMDRLGFKIVSGLQFQRTIHVLLRKGGTTRRKDVHTKVNSELGFLKERKLTARLAWDHYTDSIDKYCETVFGTDAQGQYPLSTEATAAILANYADNLTACLWNGDISLDDGSDEKPAREQAMALYDGVHTCVKHDIEDGIISETNGNLVHCDAITAPVDNDDSTPYDNFIAWHLKWDARLRKAKTRVYMNEITANNIAAGYANKYHGNFKVEYEQGNNFKIPGLSRVTICPVADFGEGDRMYATIYDNFIYGVDTLSNQTGVNVKIGTDIDLRQIQFQIQSIQGVLAPCNPFKYAFCMSDGSLATSEYVAGDFVGSNLVVTTVDTDGKADVDGKVTVNGANYTAPVPTSVNQVLTLVAVDGAKNKFSHWSNGKTEKTLQLTATGMTMGITAIFKKEGE